jgi:tetratricopeptide (TPR) repeat protein
MNKPLLIVLVLLMSATAAQACIWDRDTLAMERAKFPEVNELIVGYFPRHSPAYYQWRKEQVLAIPVEQRTAGDYDDLGASFDKLGEHGKAIQTMLDKMARFPDEGVYESHANLGTFYIHNGELEKGVKLIGKAIEINPDAHFGREVYQKLLVEYVIEQRATGHQLPLERYPDRAAFADFVLDRVEDEEPKAELKRAIQGVLGMMRFGNYDSPVLLEVLGDLLSRYSDGESGLQRLAARAYLKASYEVEDPVVQTAYRKKSEGALSMQYGVDLGQIESKLQEEIAEGDAYFAKIEADEKAWIAAGKDVDAEFQRVYYQSTVLETSKADSIAPKSPDDAIRQAMIIGLFLLVGGLIVVVFASIYVYRRWFGKPAAAASEPAR